MTTPNYTTKEEGILDTFPDLQNFGVRSLTFVNKSTGDIIEDAINIDSQGNLQFKDKKTEVTLKELVSDPKGYVEEINEDGEPVLYFFDNKNEKVTLGQIVEKLFVTNITKGIKWFEGRAMENLNGECLKMDEYIVENFFTEETKRSAIDVTDVDKLRVDESGGWKNIWHDVPCIEIITDDFVDNKYINTSSVIHYKVKSDRPVKTGFRIYDATADIELARNVHMAGGSSAEDFVTYSVPVEYQGPLPDTPVTTESQCKKMTFRDLQNIQVENQKERGAGLVVSQDGYVLVPLTQHVIKVQWCICELAIQFDNLGNRIGDYNREFFEFGDSSLDMVIFNANTTDVDRTQFADRIEIDTLDAEIKELKSHEVLFDIVPFNDVNDYSITIGTNANFSAWVTTKTERGFTVEWDRAPKDAIIDWSLYHRAETENELDRLSESDRVLNHFLFGDQLKSLDFCEEVEEEIIIDDDCDALEYEHDALIARALGVIGTLCDDCIYEVDDKAPKYPDISELSVIKIGNNIPTIEAAISSLEGLRDTADLHIDVYDWISELLAIAEEWRALRYVEEALEREMELQELCYDKATLKIKTLIETANDGVDIIDEYPIPILCPYEFVSTVEVECEGEVVEYELESCVPVPPPEPPFDYPPFPEPPQPECIYLPDVIEDFDNLKLEEECECCDCCDLDEFEAKWIVHPSHGEEGIPDTRGHIYFVEDEDGNRKYSTDKNELAYYLEVDNDSQCEHDTDEEDAETYPFETIRARIFVNDTNDNQCPSMDFNDWSLTGVSSIYTYFSKIENIRQGNDCDISFLPEVMTQMNLEKMYGYNHIFSSLNFSSDAEFINHDEAIKKLKSDSLTRLSTDKKQKPDELPVQSINSGLLLSNPNYDDFDFSSIFNGNELKMFDSTTITPFLIKFGAFLGSSAMGHSFVYFDPRPNIVISEDEKPLYPGYEPIYSKTTQEDLLDYIYTAVYPAIKIPRFPNFKVGNFMVNGALYNPLFDLRNYRIPGVYVSNFSKINEGDLFQTKDVLELNLDISFGDFFKLSNEDTEDSYVILKRDIFNTVPQRTTVTNGMVGLVTPSGIKFDPIAEQTYLLNQEQEEE